MSKRNLKHVSYYNDIDSCHVVFTFQFYSIVLGSFSLKFSFVKYNDDDVIYSFTCSVMLKHTVIGIINGKYINNNDTVLSIKDTTVQDMLHNVYLLETIKDLGIQIEYGGSLDTISNFLELQILFMHAVVYKDLLTEGNTAVTIPPRQMAAQPMKLISIIHFRLFIIEHCSCSSPPFPLLRSQRNLTCPVVKTVILFQILDNFKTETLPICFGGSCFRFNQRSNFCQTT